MKITLSCGWTVSLCSHNGNKEQARDRGTDILRETKKTSESMCGCVCHCGAVRISYSAVTLAPAIVGDTSASSSQGCVPTCITGLVKAPLTLPGLLPGSGENQGLSIAPSDTVTTCSAPITIPCFSEIVSAAIFSPNYFLLLRGLSSGLEPEEAEQGGAGAKARVGFNPAGCGQV